MKFHSLLIVFTSLFLFNSCCSSRKQCSMTEFGTVILYNFEQSDVSDNVFYVRYEKGSNWTQVIDSFSVFPVQVSTDPASGFKITNGFNTLDFDYAVKVNNINKEYYFGNFGTKVTKCGKCYMKNNNQFGNELNSYILNSKSYVYENSINITK
jgi:hypothetical protein